MTVIVLTGDSHLGALRHAYGEDPGSYPGVEFLPLGPGGETTEAFYVKQADGTIAVTAENLKRRVYPWSQLAEEARSARYVVSLPMNTSRILRDYDWAGYAPWQLVQGGRELPLSTRSVEALIDRDSAVAIQFLLDLAEIGLRTAVLEAPRFFSNARHLDGTRMEVAAFVDRAYRERVRSKLEAGGIPVIAQPAETITAMGTTSLDFDHPNPDDNHHANAAYGKLALGAVLDFCGR